MFIDKRSNFTNFNAFRAFYCRCMLKFMRDNLHIKIIFTLICLFLCIGFAYYHYEKTESNYKPVYNPNGP